MNDISPSARSIGRIIDRQCRQPGTYLIEIHTEAQHGEAPQMRIKVMRTATIQLWPKRRLDEEPPERL